jgi:hypothetical protein
MTRYETIKGINKRLGKMKKEKLERLLRFIDQKADDLNKSGLPYTGDPETDEILDDPELTMLGRSLINLKRWKPRENLSPGKN